MNATTCASPADGGDCRGNLERWAFNEATGDCEPFTYGGCGGNGNRVMCKEMCERHCVEEDGREVRERLSRFDCCRLLEVRGNRGEGDQGVKMQHPERFGEYRMDIGLVGGRDHWVSFDGESAIWKSSGKWQIGPLSKLGGSGDIETRASKDCPEGTGFAWKFYVESADLWFPANRGLRVFCVFE